MTLAEYAKEHGLHRVGARPNLVQYLKQAWSRRDFAIAMARFRIQANQERNRLGMLWLVLQQPVPLAQDQIGVFSRLYPMNARPIQQASGRLIKQSN